MANKKYYEESVNYLANAIRAKLSYPNASVGKEVNKQYKLAEMEEAIDNIPIRLGFPSAKAVKIDIPLSGYKAPANGWVAYNCGQIQGVKAGSVYKRMITLENRTKGIATSDNVCTLNYGCYFSPYRGKPRTETVWNGVNRESMMLIPVSKGDEVFVSNDQAANSGVVESFFIQESEPDMREALIKK